MLGGVCFDLDGTLIDSTDAIVESFEHVFTTLGEDFPGRARVMKTFNVPIEEQFQLLAAKDPDRSSEVFRVHYDRDAPSRTSLLPGAAQALTRLKAAGLKLGIATSRRRASAEPILKHLGVMDCFDHFVGVEDVENPKPHPESLYLVLEQLGLRADSMVFVGDSPHDIHAAHGAGVISYGVTTGYSTRSELLSCKPAGLFDDLEAVVERILGDMGKSAR